MKIICITHADFEGPGYFETWAKENEHDFEIIRPYRNELLDIDNNFDLLIIMGGPQSPNEKNTYPYLTDEINFIKKSIANNKIIIGICLGAQLISESLGVITEASPHKEVGIFPIQLTQEAKNVDLFSDFPEHFLCAHWHNDMPGLPDGAEVLASSEGCPRQIIQYSDSVFGFQCHLDFTKQTVSGLIEKLSHDLQPGKYIQTADEILNFDYFSINKLLGSFLDKLINK